MYKCPRCNSQRLVQTQYGYRCLDCNFEFQPNNSNVTNWLIGSLGILFVVLVIIPIMYLTWNDITNSNLNSITYKSGSQKASTNQTSTSQASTNQTSTSQASTNETGTNQTNTDLVKLKKYILLDPVDKSYYFKTKSPTKDYLWFHCKIDKKKRNHLEIWFYHGSTIRYGYPLIVNLYGLNEVAYYPFDDKKLLKGHVGAGIKNPTYLLESLYSSSKESDDMSLHFSEFIYGKVPEADNQFARFDLTNFEIIYNNMKDCK